MMEVKQAVSILKAKLECDERETSGNYELCNHKCECCYLNYEQGTKGERKEGLKMAIEALEKQSEAEQFARWVATKIFSSMFEDDPVAFAELACRKLAKLGIIKADGDEWVVVEPQESEEEDE